MRKIFRLFSLAALSAFLLTSCGDDTEPTPDTNPDAEVFEVPLNNNSKTPAISGEVSTSDGSAKIRLNVVSTSDLDQIFIMKSEDNGTLNPLTVSTITTSDGKTFNGGSTSYSLKVPSSTKSFILDIPVTIRSTSAAVTDVYYIWITNGSGSFLKPTKNVELGPAVLTLTYGGASNTASFSTATVDLGSQSATPGSLLVTSGQVSALNTADYNDAPASADIRLVTLDASGKKNNSATNVYFYSPANITDANPPSDGTATFTAPTGSRTTVFADYSGSFDAATGSTLSGLVLGSTKSIKITAGNTYAFQTAAGKKGLIKVNSLTAETDTDKGYVANVTVKVLN